MKILSSIGKIFKGTPGQLLAKASGAAGLGIVAYDANHIGKVQADYYASEKDAAATSYYVNNAMYSTNMSKFESGIKNKAVHMQLDQGWRRFINLGIGYVKGFTSMLVEHVVPLGLGIGALFTKGKVAKGFAGGLGIYAAYTVLKNFFGWGTPGGPIKG